MLNKRGFFIVEAAKAEQIIAECGQTGWRVFYLPEQGSSKDEFFEGVRRTLPLDPPLHSNRSWDALADSLWSGLDGLQDERIVIVWPSSKKMEAQVPEDFAVASSILKELPDSLADDQVTVGATKQLLVLRAI